MADVIIMGQEKRKGIGERSIYTQTLIEYLQKTIDDQVVKYDQTTEVIGLETRPGGSGYIYLRSARRILERDYEIVFDTINTVGIQRVSAEVVGLSTDDIHVRKVRAVNKRMSRRLRTLNNSYEKLSAKAREKVNLSRTRLAFMEHFNKPSSTKKLEDSIKENRQMLNFRQTIELFERP